MISQQADSQAVSLGLNDDIRKEYEEVKNVQRAWLQSRWPQRREWEND
jgi:hypothetical protein